MAERDTQEAEHANSNRDVGLGVRILRTFVARAVSASGTILASWSIIRAGSLTVFGVYSLWVALLLAMGLVARFGTAPQIMKYCGDDMPDTNLSAATYRGALTFVSRMGLLLGGTGMGMALVLGQTAGWLFLLFIGAPLLSQNYTMGALLRARRRSHFAPLLEFGSTSLFVSISLLVSRTSNLDVTKSIVVFTVLGLVVQNSLGRRWVSQAAPDLLRIRSHAYSTLDVVRNGGDFFAVEFGQYFSQWGLLLIVGAILAVEDVATFSSLQRLTFLTNFILGVVSNTVSSQISELFVAGQLDRLKALRKRSQRLLLSYGLSVGSILLLVHGRVFREFQITDPDATAVLTILILLQVANVATGLSPIFLRMMGYERQLRNIVSGAIVAQLLGVVVLTSAVGLVGTALGFGIAPVLKNLLCREVERRGSFVVKTEE